MLQLELFAGVAMTPQAQAPALVLCSYCKTCQRTPRAFCGDCRTRTVAFKSTCELLRSRVLHETHADSVTLRLVDKDKQFYDFASSVAGVRELVWLLLGAGICGEEAQAWNA